MRKIVSNAKQPNAVAARDPKFQPPAQNQRPSANETARGVHPSNPVPRSNVFGRVAWRGRADDLTTSVQGPLPVPNRRVYQPIRADQGKSLLELQKLKMVLQNALGHSLRINEDLSAGVPITVLPYDLRG